MSVSSVLKQKPFQRSKFCIECTKQLEGIPFSLLGISEQLATQQLWKSVGISSVQSVSQHVQPCTQDSLASRQCSWLYAYSALMMFWLTGLAAQQLASCSYMR